MFDFNVVFELLKYEPGHGLIQSFLLAMIWFSSRGIKNELKILAKLIENHDKRFINIEGRVSILEQSHKGV